MQHIRREHFAVSFVLSKVHGEEVMKIFLQIVLNGGFGAALGRSRLCAGYARGAAWVVAAIPTETYACE